MADILFTYPRNSGKPTLAIDTGANRISWSYNLNVQPFPTYGGEVVQVLSTNIDKLTIEGDVRSYAKMEEIYHWFLFYIQDATQGYKSQQGYHEDPVEMSYPERGWKLKIQPISLPGLRYGTEVVVPTWRLEAHVIDPDPEMTELTISEGVEGKESFRDLTADVEFRLGNPFSDPLGKPTKREEQLYGKMEDPSTSLGRISQTLIDQLNAFTKQEFKSVMENWGVDASKPATPTSNKDDKEPDKEKPGKQPSKPKSSEKGGDKPKPSTTPSSKGQEAPRGGTFWRGTDDRIYYLISHYGYQDTYLATDHGMLLKPGKEEIKLKTVEDTPSWVDWKLIK